MKTQRKGNEVMKRKIKTFATLLTVSAIGMSSVVPAQAFFGDWDAYKDTWHMSGAGEKKGSVGSTISSIKFNSEVETYTPVLLTHEVTSDGSSKGAIKSKIGGYTYEIPAQGHQITATVNGLSVSISSSDLSKLSKTSTSQTFYCNAMTVDYTIDSECFSLIGYKEKHTFEVDAYSPGNKKNPHFVIISKASGSIY